MALDDQTKSILTQLTDGLANLAEGAQPSLLPPSADPVLDQLIAGFNSAAKYFSAQAARTNEDHSRIEALFTQSADPIMTLAPPDWRFTSCNPAALRLFHVPSREDFVRLGPWDLSPQRQPDGRLSSEKAPEAIARAMQAGSHSFEWDHKTRNGLVVSCTVLLSRIDISGESYLQATVRDVTQEKLIERELSSIFRDSPLGIIRLSSECLHLSVNPAYESFLGYSHSELASKLMLDLIHPEDRAKTLERVNDVLTNGDGILKWLEIRYLHQSGRTVWGRVISQAVPNPEGPPTILCVIEDVTGQKAAEAQTAVILETMASGLVIQDQEGKIETFNPAALSILGLSEDQLRGRKSTDPAWKTIKEDGSPFPGREHPAMVALETGAPVKGVIMGLAFPDHTNRWIKINAIPFEGPAGRRVVCTLSDVTAELNAQVETRFVLDALRIGVWKLNPVNQSLHWDKSMYQLFEVNESDFPGHYQAWESTLTPESKDAAVYELGQALRGEKEFDTTFEIETKSGAKKFISGRGKVIRDQNGNPVLMYGLNADVTNQVKIRQELELERTKSFKNAKLASLGEMSAGIAHEINNPLAIISGSIGLISKLQDEPEKLAAKIEVIKRSCNRIARIVGGLKKFSRSGDRSQLLKHELAKIVQDSFVLIEAKSKRHATPVTMNYQSRSHILCDEVEVEQVLVNLIGNAIDAIKDRPERWVRLSLFDDGQSVVLRVTDSGSGIPAKVREKLFEPFFTTKKVGEGTGLGLSVAKGILDEHKATIAVLTDSPNTCFEIRFPRAEELKSAA